MLTDHSPVGICFTLIGTFAVACRAAALAKRRRKIGYDDYSMFAAYLCSIGFTIASYISVRWGVGLKVGTAPASWAANAVKVSCKRCGAFCTRWLRRSSQAVYVIEIFYYFSIYLIKMSIVFLYLRLGTYSQARVRPRSFANRAQPLSSRTISTRVLCFLE